LNWRRTFGRTPVRALNSIGAQSASARDKSAQAIDKFAAVEIRLKRGRASDSAIRFCQIVSLEFERMPQFSIELGQGKYTLC